MRVTNRDAATKANIETAATDSANPEATNGFRPVDAMMRTLRHRRPDRRRTGKARGQSAGAGSRPTYRAKSSAIERPRTPVARSARRRGINTRRVIRTEQLEASAAFSIIALSARRGRESMSETPRCCPDTARRPGVTVPARQAGRSGARASAGQSGEIE